MARRTLVLLGLAFILGCSNSTGPEGPQATIQNRLMNSVEVFINDVDKGSVPAQSSASFAVTNGKSTIITYSVIKSTTKQGAPVGDDMAGAFSAWTPTGDKTFEVTNIIGTQHYFCPTFTNTTNYGMLIAINYGLVAENLTYAVIPAHSSNVKLGYFLSYSNSNICYWRDGSNYNGYYRYWNSLPVPDAQTGVLTRTIDQVP